MKQERQTVMVAWILFIAVLEDPRDRVIERDKTADFAQFYEREDAFGRTRIEFPKPLNSEHKIMAWGMTLGYEADRFLLGNKTLKFDAQHMKTTFLPLGAVKRGEEPKPRLQIKEIEERVRKFFGENFFAQLQGGRWLVKGYPITAEQKCLSCHKEAKLGDPLGYLVYALGKEIPRKQ